MDDLILFLMCVFISYYFVKMIDNIWCLHKKIKETNEKIKKMEEKDEN